MIKYLQWLIAQLNFQLAFSNFSKLNTEIVKAFKLNWQLCLCINLMVVGFLFLVLFVWDFFWLNIAQIFDLEKRHYIEDFCDHKL